MVQAVAAEMGTSPDNEDGEQTVHSEEGQLDEPGDAGTTVGECGLMLNVEGSITDEGGSVKIADHLESEPQRRDVSEQASTEVSQEQEAWAESDTEVEVDREEIEEMMAQLESSVTAERQCLTPGEAAREKTAILGKLSKWVNTENSRRMIYANLEGAMSKFKKRAQGEAVLEELLEDMRTLDTQVLFVTEFHSDNALKDQAVVEKVLNKALNVQRRNGRMWTVHIHENTRRKAASVGIAVRSDVPHRVFRGIGPHGEPTSKSTNQMGRYMWLLGEARGDIDDYLLVYAPNSGSKERTLPDFQRVAEEVHKARMHHKLTTGRRLNVIGDLNFSLAEERFMRNGSTKKPVHEVVEGIVGRQRVANVRASEERIGKQTFLAEAPIDVEATMARREKR